jgi:hypothetical protein
MRPALHHTSNPLNEARVIVLDVPDPSAYRPTRHRLRWIRREKGFEVVRVRQLFPEPSTPRLRPQHHRHPIVRSAQSSFGRVVTIAKLRIPSPAGERQFSHKPANAIRRRSASATA